jgi:pimeloyl-ACP methyl ester carboxylesterase
MSTFLLVHGSWHGAWCWERVAPLLEAEGHRVVAIDLPGHGADTTPFFRIGLGSYARRIEDAARELPEPPVLVGHSMGGAAITRAASRVPERFRALVYLCAFVPLPGDSVVRLAREDARSQVPESILRRLLSVRLRRGTAEPLFYGECSPEDAAGAAARLRPDPSLPLFQKLALGQRIAAPRFYVACERDRALTIERQRAMASRAGIECVVTLDTDHSPFYSTPDELAHHLLDLCG